MFTLFTINTILLANHWRASETLSGVYHFEICDTYIYVYMDVHEA